MQFLNSASPTPGRAQLKASALAKGGSRMMDMKKIAHPGEGERYQQHQ